MGKLILFPSGQTVHPQPQKLKQPRRRKRTVLDPDNLPSLEEANEMLRELYGEVPAFLRGGEL